ncbi:E3 ubiquitin-protein ligase RNFT1-like isoform X1 [Vitis riparia]|uniref:E3 ubiquitin-protein ligase RNFT1-like isoform X1 n=1 Tax=Vitis riparia TaxID=96939 RepID=UPI00155AAB76|nr:E3 ubiquitin-protein ligase RNFT1-like isoform X1 [Vitis riparia]XP_034688539.1 E3 ubiquitin-protein ligase RNFT1-like isoform X1 [Vitis riparia]
METSGSNSRYGIHIAASNFIQAPLAALLEYSGIFSTRSSSSQETDGLIAPSPASLDSFQSRSDDRDRDHDPSSPASTPEEVSIRIIGAGEQEREAVSLDNDRSSSEQISEAPAVSDTSRNESGSGVAAVNSGGSAADGEPANGGSVNNRDSSYQRYDIQQFARWIEQILPFSLLLLVVFIRQHLQDISGFFVTIWIAAVMFKSNDILRKQTALKGERKLSVLTGITAVFMLHVICVYWWYRNNDLLYPLVLLPPKAIPPFWHAIFIIMVNDTMVRQAAMALKCLLLMYYKNSRGRDYRKQGQMLTLVEYLLLLYRALLPTPVWYRFFLNKEYGSLFSSLTTGLYLTFKLTSVVEKVQSFFAALRALSRKEVHYGSYATSEQVNAAGDLCAICQEKMHAPILLRCKHIFCEDCVSEWFERERTCPLCRALVKPADIRSYGDGSTSLFFQIF